MYVIHAHLDASQTKVNILVLHSLTLISSCEKNSLNGPYFTLSFRVCIKAGQL